MTLDTSPASPPPPLPFWSGLLWLTLTALGLLLLVELARVAPCWLLPLPVLVLAYPLWLALSESFLYQRRLILTGATVEGCLTRRMLWRGRLGTALRVIPALVFALLLLALGIRLTAPEWTLLFADGVFLAVLYHQYQRRARSQVHPEMLGVFVRRWPLSLSNFALLTVAFFLLSFFLVGAPDLRQMSWQQAAEQAFAEQSQTLTCSWAGWLVGILAALEQGTWALAQRYIPELPAYELRLMAWALFLLQLSLLSLIVTKLFMGVLAYVEYRTLRIETLTGTSTFAKTFIITILVLAVPFLLASLRLRDLDPRAFQSPAPEILIQLDPCREQQAQTDQTRTKLNDHLESQRRAVAAELDKRVVREVDLQYAPVVARVDDYLDWYFTVIGEYERLAALVAGNFPQLMQKELEAHLFPGTDFHDRLARSDQALVEDALARMNDVTQAVKDHIAVQAKENPCVLAHLDPQGLDRLNRDLVRASGAAMTGAATGAAVAILAKNLVTTAVAKVAAQKSMQTAAALAAKVAAKKAGGALAAGLTGTAVCSPGGPFAVVCGVVAGGVTWLVIDKVAIEVDEAFSRKAMRAEILDVLEEQKHDLISALQQRHRTLLGRMAEGLQATIDGNFIPNRDGL